MGVFMTTKSPARALALPVACLLGVAIVAGCGSKKSDNPTITLPSNNQPASASPVPSATATQLSIVVKGGKAQGGVQALSAKLGSQVVITVTSTDTTSEIHLHGYDLKADLAPGKDAVISFKASISGVFELELEGTSVTIANLTVR